MRNYILKNVCFLLSIKTMLALPPGWEIVDCPLPYGQMATNEKGVAFLQQSMQLCRTLHCESCFAGDFEASYSFCANIDFCGFVPPLAKHSIESKMTACKARICDEIEKKHYWLPYFNFLSCRRGGVDNESGSLFSLMHRCWNEFCTIEPAANITKTFWLNLKNIFFPQYDDVSCPGKILPVQSVQERKEFCLNYCFIWCDKGGPCPSSGNDQNSFRIWWAGGRG